jgi:hypothetical protein
MARRAGTASNQTTLKQLAETANAAHARGLNKAKATIEEWFAAGDALLQAKEIVTETHGHGAWLPWVTDNCVFGDRQAERYMKLARNQAAIRAKFDIMSNMTMQNALDLVTPTKTWPPRAGQEYIGPWPPKGMATPPTRDKPGTRLPLDPDQQAWLEGQIAKQERIAAEAKRLQDEAAGAAEEARQAAEREATAKLAEQERIRRETGAAAEEEKRYQAWLEARALFGGPPEPPTQTVNIEPVSNKPTQTVVITAPDAPFQLPPGWEVDDSQLGTGRIYDLTLRDEFEAHVFCDGTWSAMTPDDELRGKAPDLATALADSEATLRAALHNFERDRIKQAADQFDEMVTNARANGVLREPDDSDILEAARLTQVWRLRITARALDRAAGRLSNGQNRPVWSTPTVKDITDQLTPEDRAALECEADAKHAATRH